jgi:hypothetical protein
MFGYIRFVYWTLRGKVLWADAQSSRLKIRMAMEVLISLVLLVVCLWALVAGDVSIESEKYFAGMLGSVVGTAVPQTERARPESVILCYNGSCPETHANKGGSRPWPIILPSFPSFSNCSRDMSLSPWLESTIRGASYAA